ncbi:hypothetical protein ACIBF1_44110 [Spirillospora sp. NPDC050679]
MSIPPPGQWSSFRSGDRIVVDVTQVFHSVEKAVDRQDRNLDAGISLEEDVASYDEVVAIVQNMMMGPSLAVHVVNSAHKLMLARYPAKLVCHPFEPQFAVATDNMPVPFTAEQQEIAKTLFNRRISSERDLGPSDAPEVEALDAAGQIQIFVILFAMTGDKLAMLKHFTGTA